MRRHANTNGHTRTRIDTRGHTWKHVWTLAKIRGHPRTHVDTLHDTTRTKYVSSYVENVTCVTYILDMVASVNYNFVLTEHLCDLHTEHGSDA